MARGVRVPKRTLRRFLEGLADTGNVTATCKELGVSVATLYGIRQRDETFAEQWEEAERVYLEGLKDQVYEWASKGWVEGQEKRVGNQVVERTVKRRVDPKLALRVLERRHPDFRPASDLEVNVPQGVLVVPGMMEDEGEWERLFGGGDGSTDNGA